MNETFITLIGYVGTEVTLAEVGAGHQVATFRVGSTPRRLVGGEWENQPTNWFTVKAWRQLAAHVHRSVRQGDPVVVHGRLTADVWQNADGQTMVRHILVATSIGHDLAKGTASFVKAPRQGPDDGHSQGDAHSPGPGQEQGHGESLRQSPAQSPDQSPAQSPGESPGQSREGSPPTAVPAA